MGSESIYGISWQVAISEPIYCGECLEFTRAWPHPELVPRSRDTACKQSPAATPRIDIIVHVQLIIGMILTCYCEHQ